MSALRHNVETEFINGWIEASACIIIVHARASEDIQRLKIGLNDVIYILKRGHVEHSDMVDDRGLWNVVGETVDGLTLRVVIEVKSTSCHLEISRIGKVSRRG